MLYFLDCLGLVIFALTGVVKSQEQGPSWLRGIIYAMLTALGGGTLRDLILGQVPIFWMSDSTSIWLTLGAALLALVYVRYGLAKLDELWFLDAISLAAFTIVGTQVALAAQASLVTSAGMGLMTGVGGGLVRDLIGARQPIILQEKAYGAASFLGGLFYAVVSLWWPGQWVEVAAIVVVITIRWGSRRWSKHHEKRDRHNAFTKKSRQSSARQALYL